MLVFVVNTASVTVTECVKIPPSGTMAGGESTWRVIVTVSLPTTPALLVPMTVIKVTLVVSGTVANHTGLAANVPLAPALVRQIIVPASAEPVPRRNTEDASAGKARTWLVILTTGAV